MTSRGHPKSAFFVEENFAIDVTGGAAVIA